MLIYVAASWKHRDKAKMMMEHLRKLGHEITCDWTEDTEVEEISEEFAQTMAIRDYAGIMSCEIFIIIADGESGMKFVEFGIALMCPSIRTIIVGKRAVLPREVFFYLSGVERYASIDEIDLFQACPMCEGLGKIIEPEENNNCTKCKAGAREIGCPDCKEVV